ncbi:undecaprenyl-diphosphatase UppP [Sphaerochaeta pleomorpha str. Grapes]|uniref:Undecaprenyl-diphosphatase n=1 Tax=Sphaerochaeta pleomorpha (strain ATCC BAA-1885 / DSM 22778 / Grapes) TaxID=158190 RepID=G8QQM1_SPHPG|nr:undecaprenyl-diphosphate phosphatase [Sphaerochaeta pleomorpha]AEV30951.1 undecaprenyl-diphosphatase UppP [Sphaerochaeta pleomorpha str. Grapes]
MMELLKALLLGIVQGITEWLPISSTGHLLLLDELIQLQISPACKELFMVIIQLASILAVIILYFSTLNPFSTKKGQLEKKQTWNLWGKVLVATLPAGVAGVLLNDFMDTYLYIWPVIVVALASYGLVYILLEKKGRGTRKPRITTLSEISYADAAKMGAFQMLALVPGTSRSGSTILGGIIIGIDRPIAAQFSFFMAIPIMAGASLLKLLKIGFSFTNSEYLILAVGFITSFVVSLFCIKALVAYVRKHDFSIFGFYRIALALVVTIFFLTTGR